MKTGYIFIILLGIAFLLSAFTTLGYLIYYRYYLSKCIENGLKKRNKLKKLIEPFRFFLISFILFSIISCTFVSVENYHMDISNDTENLKLYTNSSTVKLFSHESDIPGYTRYEKKCGEYIWIYYINNNNDDGFPYMLIYNSNNQLKNIMYQFIPSENISGNISNKKNIENSEWYVLKAKQSDCSLLIYPDNNKENVMEIIL